VNLLKTSLIAETICLPECYFCSCQIRFARLSPSPQTHHLIP